MNNLKSMFMDLVQGFLGSDDKVFNSQQVNIKNAYGRLKPIYENKYESFKVILKSF